jgi:AraC-like DNA-binding protein
MRAQLAQSLPLSLFAPPYKRIELLRWDDRRFGLPSPPGTGLLWQLELGTWSGVFKVVRTRPPGMALVVILPKILDPDSEVQLLRVVEACRPHSILPFHPEPHIEDLRALLRREPEQLSVEVMDYLQWRGITVDVEVRRLIRKTIDLSLELRSITGLARSLYLSRRALGRRFLTNGLPVPSHWLHFGRVLRAALRLQSSGATLSEAATRFGYPDGFALSNQMQRLLGVRPSDARRHLGWDWLVEAWIHTEAAAGGFSSEMWGTLQEDFSLAPSGKQCWGLKSTEKLEFRAALPPRLRRNDPSPVARERA